VFRLTSKVKIAAGLAAGALTLGGAGAYAAANANNTINVTPTSISIGKAGTTPLNLIGFNGTTSLTPPTFTNAGECVSWLAQNKNIALAPQGSTTGTVKLSKNYHGKLMAGANARTAGRLGRVLEIGTGCGYQAALLAQLARQLYSVERLKEIYRRAYASQLGY